MDTATSAETREIHPTFREALRFWTKLGFISFGGPAGQIAIMQTELVDKRRWITQPRFLHALNFCMLLPGPEAQQLAIYIGWLLHGTRGGIVAGVLFVLPSVFILWALSFVYAAYGNIPAIAAIFYGLKPVVMAIVAAAVVRIARKSLTPLARLGCGDGGVCRHLCLQGSLPCHYLRRGADRLGKWLVLETSYQ